MRSAFAVFLRGFTLPFGATTGRRIVFNGDDGTIVLYRDDGTQAIVIGGSGANSDTIRFLTGDSDELIGAQITPSILGVGAVRNLLLNISAPGFTAATQFPSIVIRSQSQNNAEPPEIVLDHDGADGVLRVPTVVGEATLVAGTVTVAHASIRANSRIFLSRRLLGAAPGNLTYVRTAGVSFTINSDNAGDTGTITWLVLDE